MLWHLAIEKPLRKWLLCTGWSSTTCLEWKLQHLVAWFSHNSLFTNSLIRAENLLTLPLPKTKGLKITCLLSSKDVEKVRGIICLWSVEILLFILGTVTFRYHLYRIFGGLSNISSEFLGNEGVKKTVGTWCWKYRKFSLNGALDVSAALWCRRWRAF